MWKKLSKKNRKKMTVFTFIFSPIIMMISFVIGAKLASLVGMNTGTDAKLFVSVILMIMYIVGLRVFYKGLLKTEGHSQ